MSRYMSKMDQARKIVQDSEIRGNYERDNFVLDMRNLQIELEQLQKYRMQMLYRIESKISKNSERESGNGISVSMPYTPVPEKITLFNLFSSRREDDYLEDAIDYQLSIERAITRLCSNRIKLEQIRQQINNEKQILKILFSGMMKKKVFASDESYQLLKKLILSQMVDSEGNLTNEYVYCINEIKERI